ncbi:MAG TPA: OmpA family protein [Pedobacter sp.]
MAFDLNKNDGSKDSSGKTQTTSKFDLSKGAAGATVTGNAPKSKTWVIGLVGILIIGGGIWYYSSPAKTVSSADPVLTKVTPSDSTASISAAQNAKVKADVAVTDTTAATESAGQIAKETPAINNAAVVPAHAAAGNVNAATLNNKIPATFSQGSSSFSRVDQSLVRRITSYLAKNPEASVHVNGYASSDGSLEINQTISQARADAFKKYLVSKSVAESRVVAVGKGIENPIASNNSNAGRKKNRRVEITLP